MRLHAQVPWHPHRVTEWMLKRTTAGGDDARAGVCQALAGTTSVAGGRCRGTVDPAHTEAYGGW